MPLRMILCLWLPLILAFSACDQKAAAPDAAKSAATNSIPQLPTRAQPRLQTLKLWLGVQEITAEIAMSRAEITSGMMFRTNVLENEGMLFVFAGPMRASFWMHNVPIPLSCAYIDPDGVILETREMKAQDDTPIVAETDNVQYVLEMKQGWFERNKIGAGVTVRTERGSFRQTFQPRR